MIDQDLARELNRFHGSSMSGMSVIVNTTTGKIGRELFTPGSRPHLGVSERLVTVGHRFHASQIREWTDPS